MLPASILMAMLLGAAPARCTPAAPSAAQLSHFDLGRQAFRQGRYETALHEMMLTLMERPSDARAREYMRLAGEKLVEQDRKGIDQGRRALMLDYREALEKGRLQAQAWTGWVLESKAAASGGRWALSFDDAQRVIEDNPSHAEAQAARKDASAGLEKVLAAAGSYYLSPKNWLIYRGLFFFINSRPAQAHEALASALASRDAGEIGDTRLRMYLAMVAPAEATAPLAVASAASQPARTPEPREPAAAREPAAVIEPAAEAPAPPRAARIPKVRKPSAEIVIEEEPRLTGEEIKARKADAARLYSVGLVLYGQGSKAEAVLSWKQSASLDPDNKFVSRALKHAEQELREASQ